MGRVKPYSVYMFLEGAGALLFSMIFTTSAIYQITIAQLTPLQLVLVGTSLEISVFVFEIPTGIVADVFSRRLSIIIGYFLIGIGFFLEGSLPFFIPMILAQILWGIGYTFTSGATQAWITDEIGEGPANRAFLRGNQISQFMALVGIGCGAVLGSIRINLPIQLGGILLFILGILLIIIMPETGFKRISRSERNPWHSMVDTFRGGLKMLSKRPALVDIMVIGLFFGLYSEGFDRLWTKLLLDNFSFPSFLALQPVVWISLIRAGGMLLTIGGSEIALRKVNTSSHAAIARSMIWLTLTLIIGLISFTLAQKLIWVVIAYLMIYLVRNLISPLYTAWVNQSLESEVRATVLSMSSQVDAIGQIAGGPIIGIIGNIFTVQIAIIVSSLTLTPVLPLLVKANRQKPEYSQDDLRQA